MKILTLSKDFSISDIMLEVQKASMKKEFEPFEVKIGRGTYYIKNAECATFFSLGIVACIDAKEIMDAD